eukprot:6746549-Prymnesium_polylepis.1
MPHTRTATSAPPVQPHDARLPRVALCLAGAWREMAEVSWATMLQFVVEPNNAAVFIVTSNDEGEWKRRITYNGTKRTLLNMYAGKQPSKSVTVNDLKARVGPRLHGAV